MGNAHTYEYNSHEGSTYMFVNAFPVIKVLTGTMLLPSLIILNSLNTFLCTS